MMESTKSEARNSKQIQMRRKEGNFRNARLENLYFPDFEFVSDFELRASDFFSCDKR